MNRPFRPAVRHRMLRHSFFYRPQVEFLEGRIAPDASPLAAAPVSVVVPVVGSSAALTYHAPTALLAVTGLSATGASQVLVLSNVPSGATQTPLTFDNGALAEFNTFVVTQVIPASQLPHGNDSGMSQPVTV